MRNFGIEIEFYRLKDMWELQDLLDESNVENTCLKNKRKWQFQYESSLRGLPGGWELKSPILQNTEQIPLVCAALNTVKVKVNQMCGLHVHCDASDFTPQRLAALLAAYQDQELTIDERMIPSRRKNRNRYCKTVIGKTVEEITKDRRHKISFQSIKKFNTVEFRHHHGTLDSTEIISWVEFVIDMMEAI